MSNQKFGVFVYRDAELAAHDALPPALKRLSCRAPYKFRASRFFEELKNAKGDVDAAARVIVDNIAKRRDQRIRECWGADHPMIGQRKASRI